MQNHNLFHSQVVLLMTVLLTSMSLISCANRQNTINSLADIDENKYKTIVIGEQEWMAENLKTTKFNDGLDIQNVAGMTEWVQMESPAFSWYNNDISNKTTYGALYNWHAVNTGLLCPKGWHVATDNDWEVIINYLLDDKNDNVVVKLEKLNFLSSFGGYRYGYYWGSGIFYEIDENGYWWTSTKCTDTHAWSRTISKKKSKIYRSYFVENNGFAVRCVKDN